MQTMHAVNELNPSTIEDAYTRPGAIHGVALKASYLVLRRSVALLAVGRSGQLTHLLG